MSLRYLSVCSGIEAATQAWSPLGWKPVAFSEIEPFPCAVLAHHYPDVPNWGDMSKFKEWPDADVDVLAGGTPCQSFSVAGLRQGLSDPRGNLALTYLAIAARYRPRWLVWENVPGVLSAVSHDAPDALPPDIDLDGPDGPPDGTEIVVEDEYDADETHALWCFMAGAAELGYHGGFRTFDAQYVRTRRFPWAIPQRRRRVFFVGYIGDWRRAAAVLFDRESLSGNPPPRREAGQVDPTVPARSLGGGGLGTDFDCDGGLIASEHPYAGTVSAKWAKGTGGPAGDEVQNLVAHTLKGEGFDASEDGTGRDTPIIPVISEVSPTLRAGGNTTGGDRPPGTDVDTCETLVPVAFDCKGTEVQFTEDGSHPTLRSMGHNRSHQNAGGHAAVAIQERAVSENLQNGPGGKGWQEGVGYTLEARNKVQAVAFAQNQRGELRTSTAAPQLTTGGGKPGEGYPAVMQPPSVAFDLRGRDGGAMPEGPHDTASIRAASGGSSRSYVAQPWAVRRLTPRECERLMGNTDDFTRIPYKAKPPESCPDGPRYKALGNSWAVNVAEWIGERIDMVEAME